MPIFFESICEKSKHQYPNPRFPWLMTIRNHQNPQGEPKMWISWIPKCPTLPWYWHPAYRHTKYSIFFTYWVWKCQRTPNASFRVISYMIKAAMELVMHMQDEQTLESYTAHTMISRLNGYSEIYKVWGHCYVIHYTTRQTNPYMYNSWICKLQKACTYAIIKKILNSPFAN